MRIFHHNNKSSWYHETFYEKADPRIRDRWLMGDPLQMILIYGFYVLLIMYILPRFMRDRKPFDVDKPLIVLNTLVFTVSTYFVIKGFVPWFFIFNWRCEPIDYTDSDLAMRVSLVLIKKIKCKVQVWIFFERKLKLKWKVLNSNSKKFLEKENHLNFHRYFKTKKKYLEK